MDLDQTKILVAILFFIIRFTSAVLPIKLYKILKHWEGEEEGANFISEKRHAQVLCFIATCQSFGGGVLLATCFLHMMPDVYFSLEHLKRFGRLETNYPLSQLAICAGFFIVYFAEEIAHWLIERMPPEPCKKQTGKIITVTPQGSGNKIKPEENGNVFRISSAAYEKANLEKQQLEEQLKENDEFDTNDYNNFVKKVPSRRHSTMSRNSMVIPYSGRRVPPSSQSRTSLISSKENSKTLLVENVDDDTISINSELYKQNEKNLQLDKEAEEQEKVLEGKVKSQQQILRCLFTVSALSLHSIFEGFAIGLQNSAGNIWYLFIAVAIHSAIILFCIGLEFLIARTKAKTRLLHTFVLSITSPIGVLLGLLITTRSDMNTPAKSVAILLLEGMSTGTILYITFFEVLNREKERRVYRLRRGIFIILGFALMAALQSVQIYE